MQTIEQWDVFEAAFEANEGGNPFSDVQFSATFRCRSRSLTVDGFFDGGRTWRVRFMPDSQGEWTYTTASNHRQLTGRSGQFVCAAPSAGNRGPVSVARQYHFAYADGTPFSNIGTTCYAWAHQGQAMVKQTLDTLAQGPFNKLRMCVFPKSYLFNNGEPPVHAFPVLRAGTMQYGGQSDSSQEATWLMDLSRFEPAFFQNIDCCVQGLLRLGIEADIILLHPYDRWGYAKMPPEAEDRYLRYVCSRLSAFRNVWWSFANEWDLFRNKSVGDWERHARIIQESDPYGRLRSIHNAYRNYDHTRPWVTHVSFQGHPEKVSVLRKDYGKPVVVDECGYEGDISNTWGNLSAQEMTWRFWLATCLGGYCGHGETYEHPEELLWWSKGGVLRGQSPRRLSFLRKIVEENAACGGYEPFRNTSRVVNRGDREILWFSYLHQPRRWEVELPPGGQFIAQVIDPWEMTVETLGQQFSGRCNIPLPARPYTIVRLVKE